MGAIFDVIAATCTVLLGRPVAPAFNRPWLVGSRHCCLSTALCSHVALELAAAVPLVAAPEIRRAIWPPPPLVAAERVVCGLLGPEVEPDHHVHDALPDLPARDGRWGGRQRARGTMAWPLPPAASPARCTVSGACNRHVLHALPPSTHQLAHAPQAGLLPLPRAARPKARKAARSPHKPPAASRSCASAPALLRSLRRGQWAAARPPQPLLPPQAGPTGRAPASCAGSWRCRCVDWWARAAAWWRSRHSAGMHRVLSVPCHLTHLIAVSALEPAPTALHSAPAGHVHVERRVAHHGARVWGRTCIAGEPCTSCMQYYPVPLKHRG